MIDKQLLTDTVLRAIDGSDNFLVDIRVSPSNEIVVEIDSPEGVDIDTCARITRLIEDTFDRDTEDYELEVGSAGLTAPMRVRGQFLKNIGKPVEVLTGDGRKLHATLAGVNDDATQFTVAVETKVKEPGAKRPVLRTDGKSARRPCRGSESRPGSRRCRTFWRARCGRIPPARLSSWSCRCFSVP